MDDWRDYLMHRLLGHTQKLTPVEAWGETLYVRRMSGLARECVAAELQKETHAVSVRAIVVRHTACDQSGSPLFSDDDLTDLSAEPYNELDKICTVAYSLNEMTAADIEALQDSLKKIASGVSSSASPAPSEGQ
jgi:hypothetical protein